MNVQLNVKTGNRGIEWTDVVCNAIGGCFQRCQWRMPDGTVIICYAKNLAEGLVKAAYRQGFEHHYWRDAGFKDLAKGDEPELRFIDSMSDVFEPTMPQEYVRKILHALPNAPHHTFQSLTKSDPQVLKYLDLLPANLWVGVSTPPDGYMGKWLSHEQQVAMLRKGIEVLREVKARTGNLVWMSAEPLSWDVTTILDTTHPLDWVVIGAATNGPREYQPDPEHVRRLLMLMDATETPVFFKGNLRPLFADHDLGSPVLNRWREDFPMFYHSGELIPAVQRRQQRCREFGWTLNVEPRRPPSVEHAA